MLCLHIPTLLPAAFAEMDVAPVVQTAALLGVGFLYQSSAHRLMVEFLLAEIGRRPTRYVIYMSNPPCSEHDLSVKS